MPQNKKEGLFLSLIMSLIMIYVMAALNNDVKLGTFAASSWSLALQRLPLGYLFGIVCDLGICTPLSRRITAAIVREGDREEFQVFILRFCMVVLMTAVMTVFGTFAGGARGAEAVSAFFKYLPYNFTIALPLQMLLVAPLSLRLAKRLAGIGAGLNTAAAK